MNTFIANLKYAIRNRETVSVGGGEFSTEELKEVLATLEAATSPCDRSASLPRGGLLYTGPEAIKQFLYCLDVHFQSKAPGKAYQMTRNDTATLEMTPLTGCGLEGIALDVVKDITRLSGTEMVIVEGGIPSGECWKAVFYPNAQVLTFVRENSR